MSAVADCVAWPRSPASRLVAVLATLVLVAVAAELFATATDALRRVFATATDALRRANTRGNRR